jgi:hypothetical protein
MARRAFLSDIFLIQCGQAGMSVLPALSLFSSGYQHTTASMQTPYNKNLFIEVIQIPRAGSPWLVRVYRKVLFFKKLITSDWFLNEEQARKFAGQLSRDLGNKGSLTELTQRPPGWTLHRATK